MAILPTGLVAHAERAGIAVPPNLQRFDHRRFARWGIYSGLQIMQPDPTPDSLQHNAEAVAMVPEDLLSQVTYQQMIEDFGFQIGN